MRKVFIQNRYKSGELERVIKQQTAGTEQREVEDEDIRGVAVIPFCSSVSNQVVRLPRRHNIKTVYANNPLGPDVPGVYKIPCTCGSVYLGQAG